MRTACPRMWNELRGVTLALLAHQSMSLSDECDCEKSVPFTLSAKQAFISLLVNYGYPGPGHTRSQD